MAPSDFAPVALDLPSLALGVAFGMAYVMIGAWWLCDLDNELDGRLLKQNGLGTLMLFVWPPVVFGILAFLIFMTLKELAARAWRRGAHKLRGLRRDY